MPHYTNATGSTPPQHHYHHSRQPSAPSPSYAPDSSRFEQSLLGNLADSPRGAYGASGTSAYGGSSGSGSGHAHRTSSTLRAAREPLDSAQLWAILLSSGTRRLLGATAHAFRAACPAEGVECPPDGKVGSNSQLTAEALAMAESMGYDTQTFPHWGWRELDRIHRWLQGARTEEFLATNEGQLWCAGCAPFVEHLRAVRAEFFGSWVAAAKIDTAWVPALAPFDVSCPATAALRRSVERVYLSIIPQSVVDAIRAHHQREQQQQKGQPSSASAPSEGAQQSPSASTASSPQCTASDLVASVGCDVEVLRYFLSHYLPFLFPGAGEGHISQGCAAMLDSLAALGGIGSPSPLQQQQQQKLQRSAAPRDLFAASVEEGTNGGCSPSGLDVPAAAEAALVSAGVAPATHRSVPFAIVAGLIVVLAEPYCFNERDAANFLEKGVNRTLLRSMQPSLAAFIERTDPRGSRYVPTPPPQQSLQQTHDSQLSMLHSRGASGGSGPSSVGPSSVYYGSGVGQHGVGGGRCASNVSVSRQSTSMRTRGEASMVGATGTTAGLSDGSFLSSTAGRGVGGQYTLSGSSRVIPQANEVLFHPAAHPAVSSAAAAYQQQHHFHQSASAMPSAGQLFSQSGGVHVGASFEGPSGSGMGMRHGSSVRPRQLSCVSSGAALSTGQQPHLAMPPHGVTMVVLPDIAGSPRERGAGPHSPSHSQFRERLNASISRGRSLAAGGAEEEGVTALPAVIVGNGEPSGHSPPLGLTVASPKLPPVPPIAGLVSSSQQRSLGVLGGPMVGLSPAQRPIGTMALGEAAGLAGRKTSVTFIPSGGALPNFSPVVTNSVSSPHHQHDSASVNTVALVTAGRSSPNYGASNAQHVSIASAGAGAGAGPGEEYTGWFSRSQAERSRSPILGRGGP